ncbi:MAG: 50S ribosomal protein L24 [Candidatus Buchananbacteria bacterium]|nr:50S ribosomal protein L24 [Candidatus Buchananbacteria bacterium]
MKIKSGDKVKVIAGKDKGKKGKVLQVFPEKKKVSVEGINLAIKHMRPRRQNEQGQKIEFPAPLNVSNLMLICPKCNKTTRVKYKVLDKVDKKSEKKKRMCNKCNELID